MNDWTDDLRQGVEELAGEARRSADVHLEPEEIADYRDGRLSPADAERVQSHLVACRECAALLLDLEGLADPAFGAAEPWSAADADAVWEGVRSGLGDKKAAASVIPFPARVRPPRWLQALAAALLIAVLGLSTRVASLRHTVHELSRPEVNAIVLDLYPEGSGRRSEGEGEGAEVRGGARFLTVSLHPAAAESYPDYEIEAAGADGRPIWQESGLRPDDLGLFLVTVPRSALSVLAGGDVRLRLFGLDAAGGRHPVGEFTLRLGDR